MSVYQNGYSAWESFDSLPKEVREAHNIVWTGYTYALAKLSKEDAQAIVELDAGKYMLTLEDVGGYDERFD